MPFLVCESIYAFADAVFIVKEPYNCHMENKTLFAVTGTVFSLVALMHLLRSIYGWPAVIGSWTLPLWASYLGIVVAGALAYSSWQAYAAAK